MLPTSSRPEIIGGIEPALRDAYTKKWEDEEEDLGRDEFGDLFSHIRMVYRRPSRRARC